MRSLLCILALALSTVRGQDLHFDHLFTIGAEGVNPSQKYAGRLGRLLLGAPGQRSPLVVPNHVAVDREQRIWITDRGSLTVHMFDVLENRYKVIRGAGKVPFRAPAGIDSDSQGRIYVADSVLAQVFVFEATGEFDRALFGKHKPPLREPGALAVSHDLKSIFVADPPRGKVVVLNQEGEIVREWGSPGLYPAAIALAGGEVFVFDIQARHVQVFTPKGELVRTIRWSGVRKPSAFTVDPERGLYFVGDADYETVQAFNQEGNPVSVFGLSGSRAGELRSPAYLYCDAWQRVWVVDSLNGKVLVFGDASVSLGREGAALRSPRN